MTKFVPFIVHEEDGIWGYGSDIRYLIGRAQPRYPVPSTIGYVSPIGLDYPDIAYIDDANHDDPVIVWMYDARQEKFEAMQRAYDTYY